MKVIVCLDDNCGMAFNNRRQSKDRVVFEQIASLCGGSVVFMSPYSAREFDGIYDAVVSDDNFLCIACEDDWVFAETESPDLNNTEKLVVFWWNRVYPADVYLGFDIENECFELVSEADIVGYSHPKITKCVYEKRRGV